MTVRTAPARHWRSYGTDPLPTGREALDEPFSAFPSWFMQIRCDRCGKDRMLVRGLLTTEVGLQALHAVQILNAYRAAW